MDRDEMLRTLRAFEREGLQYVLVGAAMGVHGVVRATEDLDLFIQPTHDNVERLKRAFRAVYGDDPNIDEIRAQDLLGDYPAVRYYPPTGDLYFDIMTRLGKAADFESVAREAKLIEGIRVLVATPEALYRLKKETVRPIDRQDAEALRRALLDDRATGLPARRLSISEPRGSPGGASQDQRSQRGANPRERLDIRSAPRHPARSHESSVRRSSWQKSWSSKPTTRSRTSRCEGDST